MRVGMGYDVHKLVEGRDLIIGGVRIPHTLGLLGHSDADVLLHAIMDALLGAAGLGDIGKHFPDTDPQYKGISSMKLLSHVAELIRERVTWWRTLTPRSLRRSRRCARISRRWRKTSRERSASARIRSMSRRPRRRDLASPERRKGFPHRRSARFPVFMREVLLWRTLRRAARAAAAADEAYNELRRIQAAADETCSEKRLTKTQEVHKL